MENDPKKVNKNEGVRAFVNGLSWLILLAALAYQIQLAWQVSYDFLSGGKTGLAVAFTILIGSLIFMIDYLVKAEVISLVKWNKHATGVVAVAGVVMAGVFVLEVARIDIQQNGAPLANALAREHEAALQEPLSELEQKFQDQDGMVKYDHLTKLVQALETVPEVERQGGKRPDIEAILHEDGIKFEFSGKKGQDKVLATIRSILEQKQAELAKLRPAFEAKFGKNPPTLLPNITEDRTAVKEVGERINRMKGYILQPDNYNEFLKLARQNSDVVSTLLRKYQVTTKLVLPPVKSLFIVGLEGALEPSISAATLWLIAIGTAFGGILILLFVQAIFALQKKEEEEKKSE